MGFGGDGHLVDGVELVLILVRVVERLERRVHTFSSKPVPRNVVKPGVAQDFLRTVAS